ncbi:MULTISPECIES: radical SAM protein [Clostridium]|uniref:Fe-S protein n=2 Tax=Clostridium TaxID=1485 RepID=A0A0D1BNH6_CLOBO|nr:MULTISPECIES: radical SAM protein [Clostridium]EKS4345542.1 radical SAM protein [Clostridium botulinum]MBE6079117.1 radical SAM protein [Clostridium lundense]EDU38191.1 radical SAM domain protein [Clostridium sporogenes ATCC 15579]EKS4396808.1 radical SAM protein [Clostridium botulinum]KIS21840.1 Fe-S protein [Clostridium botulinum B2 450]
MNTLENCTVCPRNCGANRIQGTLGFCNANSKIKVARASLHHWEEPCISGVNGSGTVFFSNCNLKCVFCQNYEISHLGKGKEISIEHLSNIFLKLQSKKAHNINLVTPTHYVPQIIEAIKISKSNGLTIPILYNSNGYENIETIKSLKGYIDVFLPDLKYFDDKYGKKYSNCNNYFNTACKAIKEMFNQVGEPVFSNDRIIKKGIIIRHLMLPGLLFDTKKIIDFIFKEFNHKVYISIMNQYTPMKNICNFNELNKNLNPKHYDAIIDYCLDLGIKNAFIQETSSSSKEFIPNFDLTGI